MMDRQLFFLNYPMLMDAHYDIVTRDQKTYDAFMKHVEAGSNPIMFLPILIGGGYGDFWRTRKRYRVVKGSRASKKTITTARNFIYNMMRYPDSNLLVVRKVAANNKDSTYAELLKAINDLKVGHFWKAIKNPLEIIYKPTGQKIIFRGLDDPQKISGVTVTTGHLCWVWIEEAYEMKEEAEFNFIDESIRGQLPKHLWYQLTLTLNPWNKKHWIKKKFFDPIYGENEKEHNEDPDVYAISTNYFVNEFIDDSFRRSMERLKETNPRRYEVAGLGKWGTSSGVIFSNWHEEEFDINEVMSRPQIKQVYGLDFGFTEDPTAFIHLLVDEKNAEIYAVKEFYEKGLTNKKLSDKLKYLGYGRVKVVADSSEPKSIEELFNRGIRGIKKAIKGNDSVNYGIDKLLDYKIIADPKLTPNFCTELDNYMWDPDKINVPLDEYNHLMDAMRYACEQIRHADGTLGHKILDLKKKEKRRYMRYAQ